MKKLFQDILNKIVVTRLSFYLFLNILAVVVVFIRQGFSESDRLYIYAVLIVSLIFLNLYTLTIEWFLNKFFYKSVKMTTWLEDPLKSDLFIKEIKNTILNLKSEDFNKIKNSIFEKIDMKFNNDIKEIELYKDFLDAKVSQKKNDLTILLIQTIVGGVSLSLLLPDNDEFNLYKAVFVVLLIGIFAFITLLDFKYRSKYQFLSIYFEHYLRNKKKAE